MTRHAALVLAHDNERQLRRLAAALRHGRLDVFVHADASSPLAAAVGRLDRAGGVTRAVAAHAVRWGGFGMLRATLALLDLARAHGRYATFTLLSGTDYPLRPADGVVRALDAVDRPALRFYETGGDPAWDHRFQRRFYNDAPAPVKRALNAASRRLLGRVPHRRLPPGLAPHYGSQWWTLPAAAVDVVDDWRARRPDVVRFMRRVDVPDEMFFHSVLASADPSLRATRSALRYVDWSAGGRHPKTLTARDLPAAVASGAVFARKLDERASPGVLDAADRLAADARRAGRGGARPPDRSATGARPTSP